MASARLPRPTQCKVFPRLLATALVVGFAYRVFAGGLPSVVGDWRGSLHPGEQTLRLELHVTSDAHAKLSVTIESVDQGQAVLKGSEVLFDGENFSFDVHSVSATYRGGLGADGRTLSGTWIQGGRPFPLDFIRQIHPVAALSYLAIAIAALAALFTLLRFDDRIVAALLAEPWLRPVVVFAPLVLAKGCLRQAILTKSWPKPLTREGTRHPGSWSTSVVIDFSSIVEVPAPHVLLETGAGTPSYLWFPVQDGVAEFTRVCTYDRAGFGWSEAARLPLSMSQRVRELHTLLSRAGVPGPFVMVGHSYDGALVRLFAHDYSDQVVGLVLVDSREEILASNTHLQGAIETQLASLNRKNQNRNSGSLAFA